LAIDSIYSTSTKIKKSKSFDKSFFQHLNLSTKVSQWPYTTATTICTLRVVIVPSQAELLADTEPITFTYLYRQVNNESFCFD